MAIRQDSQPISGITPSLVAERLIMEVWPSISAYAAGRLVGQLFSIPGRIGPVRITLFIGLVIFWLPLAVYFWPGRLGTRYSLTNKRLMIRKGLMGRPSHEVPLEEIEHVRARVRPGQGYFLAADLEVIDRDGQVRLVLPGVSQAESFRRAILKARDARVRVLAALDEIERRRQAEAEAKQEAEAAS